MIMSIVVILYMAMIIHMGMIVIIIMIIMIIIMIVITTTVVIAKLHHSTDLSRVLCPRMLCSSRSPRLSVHSCMMLPT